MKKPGYYSSGEFAKMAKTSVRTIRFYDKQNILKPSYVSESNARFYTDSDLARLQQILLLKYLGFSLEDIRDMTINDSDCHFLLHSLNLQQKLIEDRIEQLQLVGKAIKETTSAIKKEQSINWSQMLELIHLTNMEKSLKSQYRNANNITARINLHSLYAQNKQGWFPWIFEQCEITNKMQILELGCGNGSLWAENLSLLPPDVDIMLTDISEGMLRDAKRSLNQKDSRFTYETLDCHRIPYKDNSFDLVIANHVLFYCDNLPKVFTEISRILKPNGRFVCSTYGSNHMKEISQLVNDFDNRIVLSAEKLYDRFGLDNGLSLLQPYFSHTQLKLYEDCLLVDRVEPIIEYILSCHGNQNQYILDHYKDFRLFAEKKMSSQLRITKEAGIFICRKK